MTTKQSMEKVMNLANLPPTTGSVKQPSLGAYLLIQKCRGINLIVHSEVGRCEQMYFFQWVQKIHLLPKDCSIWYVVAVKWGA